MNKKSKKVFNKCNARANMLEKPPYYKGRYNFLWALKASFRGVAETILVRGSS
jgi:hypothetical protein